MSKEALAAFLKKVQQDPEMQAEVAALAAKHGYEFSPDELGEADLDSVVGGVTTLAVEGEAQDKDHKGWSDITSLNQTLDRLP